jgi:predicted negative regulator of RcsB-dependent stress response
MAAQSIARRPKRAQQIETDDVVLAKAIEFTEWARRNVTLVVGVAVVLVVVLGAFFWYRTDQNRRLDDAAIAFLQVEQAVMVGDDAIAARDLQQYIQQHDGTPYADEARILLGQVHLRGGRVAESIAVLEPVVSRLSSSPVGPQAALLMANAQEAAGETETAIQTYLRVADEADSNFRRQEGLMGAALLRTQLEDHAGAAELYRRLVEMNEEGTQERALFEMRLAEAEALATGQ